MQKNKWSKTVIEDVKALNINLKIDHKSWHKLKGDKKIRAAELISSALCQLIIGDNDKEAILYLKESIKWLNGTNIDLPCPSKKSPF